MNIDVLQGTFGGTDNPGLDTLDPRWAEVSGLVQSGEFAAAAEQSEALLRENIYDVRLIGYLCFGHFLDGGPATLPAIFAALASVLDGNWEAVGPAAQRAKVAQQSLGWLFKQVLKTAQHEENARGPTFKAWVDRTTAEQIDEALSHAFLLQQAIEPRLGAAAAGALEPLAKLQTWLRSFGAAVAAAHAPPPPAPAPAPAATTTPSPTAAGPAAAATPGAEEPSVAGSYHLAQLMRKIDAFATLVEQGKLAAARIVADDVSEIVAHFDPFLYFPRLFSRFARLMARHAGEMAEFEMDPEAPPAKALRALYHVDLDAFLHLE